LAKTYGSTNNEVGYNVAIDKLSYIYITGYFYGNIQFGSTILSSSGSHDIFLAKLDSSGNAVWAVKAGGNSYDNAAGITIDQNENIYLTGYFNNTANFSGIIVNSLGGDDVFVAKYDSSGIIQWVSTANGPGIYDIANKIVCDNGQYLYISGQFENTLKFGQDSIISNGLSDGFIAQIDLNGNFEWCKNFGGSDSDIVSNISISPMGTLFCVGYFKGFADFNNGQTLTSFGGTDIFLLQADNFGNTFWAMQAGSILDDKAWGLSTDMNNFGYISGFFSGTANFATNIIFSNGGFDFFVAKIDLSTDILEFNNNHYLINFVPDIYFESFKFYLTLTDWDEKNISLFIYDNQGKILINKNKAKINLNKKSIEIELSHSDFPKGIYFYKLCDREKIIATGKFIVN